ncbi:nitrile hydratase accessory protein [Variovorax dokdonensis]|uniref:Nitrile hydratase accessory protein n=1 Tax=Variovorax dokdonensis TaxID=344883 RepID=A0ABT7NH20_9BURK|nr:nitrile hydratase accessory protein [Variovorax dokdonensis]MDM0047135.1 nitrile hydratase accessory protein [Variovorax dokdonensis]
MNRAPQIDVALRRADDETVFREPWEAHAFAITVKLHERGLFTWAEWADALSQQIRADDASGHSDTGEHYYHHWLAALESLVAAKGAASGPELASYRQAWHRAADRTPHGQPIELTPTDFPA